MNRISLLTVSTMFLILWGGSVMADPPQLPMRVGGSFTLNGVQMSQDSTEGYTFQVTAAGGSLYDPDASVQGLNSVEGYFVDIPFGGTNTTSDGDTAVMHVYRYDRELEVTSPPGGLFTIGASGSVLELPLEVEVLFGDLNQDEILNLEDGILGIQVMSGMPVVVELEEDLNNDGRINLPEVLYILNQLGRE